jgi:hypothetical protein
VEGGAAAAHPAAARGQAGMLARATIQLHTTSTLLPCCPPVLLPPTHPPPHHAPVAGPQTPDAPPGTRRAAPRRAARC